jgi:predicted ATPase/Tfp pilus assembly protein PilF
MSHPFGDRLNQHLHRKHGLSQSKLAAGIFQAPAIVTDMCKGRRLTGPQVRERVIAIIRWLHQQGVLATREEANALLAAAGLSPLYAGSAEEVSLLQRLPARPDEPLAKSPPLTPAAERAGPRHNLPQQSTTFVGRETELAQLATLLANPHCRLLTLVGPGGVGKTRLALEVAATRLDRCQHGVYFIPLAPLSEPATIVPAIAASVGYTFHNDGRAAQQQLLDYVRDKELLLVLDNAEHLLPDLTLFTDLLQTAPKLCLLVTSREQLRLSSETVFAVAGLAVADAQHGEPSAAVQLFLQTAQRVRPSFTPDVADWPAIVQVCRLVGGLPLGLILAATWIDLLTPAEIAAEINQSFDFLAADLHDLPERHRSLRAIFNTSWQRLAATERAVVQRLAFFRGGFTREAAATVAGASLSLLSTLSHKSFLQLQPNRRYEIHELLRQFALDTVGEQMVELRDAHSAYYCAFLAQRVVDLKGARQQAAMTEIETDGENIRTAWQWAVKREQFDLLAPALDSLGLFYLQRSRHQEGVVLCRLAVEQLTTNSPSETLNSQIVDHPPGAARCQVRLLIWQSIFYRHLREHEAARLALRQAQEMLTSHPLVGLDTRSEQAQLLLEQAEVIIDFNLVEARALVEQSLVIYRTLADPWHMAHSFALLGEAVDGLGQLDYARQLQEEGLALRQRLGDAIGIARSLKNLAVIARHAGRFAEAEELLRRCIAMFEELHDRGQTAHAINDLAVTLVHAGKFEASLRLFEESLRIYQELDLPEGTGIPRTVSGFALMLWGQYAKARSYLQRALTVYRKTDNKSGIAFALLNLGRIALAERAYDDAQKFLEECLVIFQEKHEILGIGSAYGCLGYVSLLRNNTTQAQELIHKNLEIAVATQMFLVNMLALSNVALLWAVQGKPENAIELYTVALQNGHVANARWYHDVFGQYIAAVVQTVPADMVEAAQAQGRMREWRSTVQELLTK